MSDESLNQKCDLLLKEPEIRFAGFLDMMGNLVVGSFRKGLEPLKNETERKKMFVEAVLRIRTRQDFDENLGPVTYAAARRKNIVTFTFLVDNKVLFVSAEPNVDIDKTANKILNLCSV
ncbi:hypothetical protein BD31_I0606 [Candidatus Nitrosopumilus salaria BD31]|uniref:Roadblock/LAMTOR2 domain-containing protein n=1 Tax=Candidatus Nitrosopumilus salarius BD31 TaxID=859350 RepID=I3D322_9ARCH|nr:DUF6659 family protein [Candidatus Nitrosopumilus salaria]EIJ66115.1 hypothetical protein BD31_I0606 [Candidatus Nitrosopumilus salaria BD31]